MTEIKSADCVAPDGGGGRVRVGGVASNELAESSEDSAPSQPQSEADTQVLRNIVGGRGSQRVFGGMYRARKQLES